MKNKGIIVGLIVVIFLSLFYFGMKISYENQFIKLKNQFTAQIEADKLVYDEVWKVIKSQAEVTEKYSENFKNNYVALMESRNYGGEAMKWIQESNPNFDATMYNKLMNTIEAQRVKFTNNQKLLNDYHRSMMDLTQVFPGSLFLDVRDVPELKLVTSTKTEKTFEEGKEDDVNVF